MRRLRIASAYILLVLALLVGFTLPTIIARVQDVQTDQTQEMVSAARVQLNMSSALTVLQKLRIVAERSSSVELDSAPTMDEDQARSELLSGLEDLFLSTQGNISFSVEDFTEVSHQIILKMSGEDSLIYWEFWLADGDGNQINAAVDDDTGLILSLHYTMNLVSNEEDTEEISLQPPTPLFLIQEISSGSGSAISENGIFGELEEAEYPMETFLEELQRQYCGIYMRSRDYYFDWETDIPEPEGNSYLCSVMMVDNAGGYYVLPFSVTNSEIGIN